MQFKKFTQFIKDETLAEKVSKYDISDWPEDGIDDLQNEFEMANAREKKDYEIVSKGNKTWVLFKSNKVSEIEKAYFKN